jgi:glycosyltransferase involved in cell wall biosynthesis
MNIWIFTVVHNAEDIAPWFLRHYGSFADRILVWDDQSTDRTREILKAHPSVSLFDCPWSGLDENKALHHAYDVYPSARGKAEWVMFVDMDELIYSPNIWEVLMSKEAWNSDIIRTSGYNMVGDGLPQNGYQHLQIWQHNPMGVPAPVYSKPVIFRPEARVRWIRGKHSLEDCTAPVSEKPLLKLLHYRYLGAAYTAKRNAQNYDRVGPDKGVAWSCAPDYNGEHSPAWAEAAKKAAVNVLELPL